MEPVWLWGLPLSPMTRRQAVDAVSGLIESRRPSYFVTANTNYAMLTRQHPALREVNARAAFVLADGAPMVLASRCLRSPLPERVAGSDLIYDLCERAAEAGHRVFLYGGAAGVAEEAGRRLRLHYPGLNVVGTESPPFRPLTADEVNALRHRLRSTRPDILIVALDQPRAERWIFENYQGLGVPVCANLGAALDFVAGRVRRAPLWAQRAGLEWAFRTWLEPARMAPRYARNARFLVAAVLNGLARGYADHPGRSWGALETVPTPRKPADRVESGGQTMNHDPGPETGGRGADPSWLAYLVNQYPQTSHSFIRREIAALEARGLSVQRFSIRAGREVLVDARDRAEAGRTRVVLDAGAVSIFWSVLVTLASSPGALARTIGLALRVGRRSERGPLVHLIYLAEACLLRRWFRASGVRHVHAHFGTNSTTVAMLCRSLGGPPYSFTVHGPDQFDHPRALALGEKVGRAAFAVAISEFGRSQLYRWASYRDWPRVHVVRCGLDALFLQFPATTPPPMRRLVSVGRLVPQKGQLLLIEAAARLLAEGRDFELTLVGDGPSRGEIEGLVRHFHLEGRVRLVGWRSNEAVRGLILDCRAFVLPSFAEGLPVALMEAMALGRPVITTAIAGIPELVRPGENGWLVTPGSVAALVEALRAALDATDEQVAAMGRAGAARVRQDHDAANEAGRLAELFVAALGGDAHGSNTPRGERTQARPIRSRLQDRKNQEPAVS